MKKDPVCGMELSKEDSIVLEHDGIHYFFCSEGCRDKFANIPKEFTKKEYYDLIIIGAGPAGLTAAVYASILKINTIVIAKDIGGQAIDSIKIKNYMGFDFITGPELVSKFEEQFLQKHYLDHILDEVGKVKKIDDVFEVNTKSNQNFTSRSIIVASGMKRRKLGIAGEESFQRKGVSYSLVQDISLFDKMKIVVIGGGNSGVQTANDLNSIADEVSLVSQGNLIADETDLSELHKNKTNVYEGYDILEIYGDDKVRGVIIKSIEKKLEKKIDCDSVFIQIGMLPNNEFCRELVELNQNGEIVIKFDCSTKTRGLFACGDVTDAFGKRIIIASGEGAKAVLRVRKYLYEMDKLKTELE